jgi:hypothetical protein
MQIINNMYNSYILNENAMYEEWGLAVQKLVDKVFKPFAPMAWYKVGFMGWGLVIFRFEEADGLRGEGDRGHVITSVAMAWLGSRAAHCTV